MKKVFFLLLALSSSLFTTAQSWSALGSGTNGVVYAIDTFKNNMYAAGAFDSAGGVSAKYIAKWDGSSWSALGIGTNDTIKALTVYKGNLIVGGCFTKAGGGAASHIAVWNGSSWSPLGNGLNGNVYALKVFGSNLYAGGAFTNSGGTVVNYIAKWNGVTWSALASGLSGAVLSMDTLKSALYAGGDFLDAGAYTVKYIAKWDGTSWSSLVTGTNANVTNLICYNSHIIALGNFTNAGGFYSVNIAEWDGANWSAVSVGGADIQASTLYQNDLYIGGITMNKWNSTTWTAPLVSTSDTNMSDTIEALSVYNGNLYAGGFFDSAQGVPANHIAKWCDTCTPQAINELKQNTNHIMVYPNPSNGVFTFEVKSEQLRDKSTLEVYNMLGEKVYSNVLHSAFTIVDLSNNAKEVYLYRITASKGNLVANGKLLIE